MKYNISILLIVLLLTMTAQSAETDELVFIVNIQNPATEVSVGDIRDYYFKRKRHWPNGESVRFVDRNLEVASRDTFVKMILNKTNSDVELFWIGQKLYSGDSAPLRKTSDNGTIEFVSYFKGAVGYITHSALLQVNLAEMKVKTIRVVDLNKD